MSKSYPDSVPHPHNAHPDIERAYRMGWNHGHGIACHNVPRLGDKLFVDSLGRVTVDADNIREVHESLCWSAEENSRSYSPFEFTAHEFNSKGEGGFRICYAHDDMSDEVYPTREEAEEAAKIEGWEGTDIVEAQDSESLWEAFEAGATDSIFADLAEYVDSDYGIEEDAESASDEIDC